MVAIKSNINFNIININTSSTTADHCFIEIITSHRRYILGLSYFPPISELESYINYSTFLDELHNSYPDHAFMIFGDFNLPQITWHNDNNSISYSYNSNSPQLARQAAEQLCEIFSLLDLEQQHPILAPKTYSLDLLFATKGVTTYLHSLDALVPVDKPRHYSASFKVNNTTLNSQTIFHPSRFNFNKLDAELLNYCINSVNWFDIINLNYYSYDACLHLFYLCIYELFSLAVPRFRIRGQTFPSWYSKDLIKNIKNKKRLQMLWKDTGDPDIRTEFKKYRAICLRQARLSRRFYITSLEGSFRRNPRAFWSSFQNLKKDNTSPPFMFLNNENANSPENISNLFAKFFQSVFKPPANPSLQCNINYNPYPIFTPFDFTLENLQEAFSRLGKSRTPGPDGVPEVFIKQCSSSWSVANLKLFIFTCWGMSKYSLPRLRILFNSLKTKNLIIFYTGTRVKRSNS